MYFVCNNLNKKTNLYLNKKKEYIYTPMNHLLSAHNAYCVWGDTKAAVINCLQR